MTDRDTLLEQITADVKALAEPRRHVEPYRHQALGTRKIRWYGHTTWQPSLLDQLRNGGAAAAGEGGSRAFESKPPVALDCLDRLLAIEAGSAWWVTAVFSRPLRPTAEGNLRAMVGRARDLYLDADVADLARDVHRWLGWASVLTGWTIPPFRPRASCPVCSARRGTLRIRPDERTGVCLQCGAAWDPGTFGILVDHIRAEGERTSEAGVS